VIFKLWRLCLKLAIHGHFREVLGAYFPQMTPSVILVRKDTSLRGNVSFGPLSVCAGAAVWPLERIEKKRQSKITKVLYFTYLGRTPCKTDLPQNLCAGHVQDIIMCTKFQNEILRGCDSTEGRNFHFPIDFWMAIATAQRCLWYRPSLPVFINVIFYWWITNKEKIIECDVVSREQQL